MTGVHRLLGRRPNSLAPTSRRLQLNRVRRAQSRGTGLCPRLPLGPRIDRDRLRSAQGTRSRPIHHCQHESHQSGTPGKSSKRMHYLRCPFPHGTHHRQHILTSKICFPMASSSNHRVTRQKFFQTFRLNDRPHYFLRLLFPNNKK